MAFNKSQPAFPVMQQPLQGIGEYLFAAGADVFRTTLIVNHQFAVFLDPQCPRLVGNGVGIDEMKPDAGLDTLISGNEALDGAAQFFLFPGIGRDSKFPCDFRQHLPAGVGQGMAAVAGPVRGNRVTGAQPCQQYREQHQ